MKRRNSPRMRRSFGGVRKRVYDLSYFTPSKSEARKVADSWRKLGYYARISRGDILTDHYYIWIRKKSK